MKIRKTLDIDDDAIAALRRFAKLNRITLSEAADRLIRTGLQIVAEDERPAGTEEPNTSAT